MQSLESPTSPTSARAAKTSTFEPSYQRQTRRKREKGIFWVVLLLVSIDGTQDVQTDDIAGALPDSI